MEEFVNKLLRWYIFLAQKFLRTFFICMASDERVKLRSVYDLQSSNANLVKLDKYEDPPCLLANNGNSRKCAMRIMQFRPICEWSRYLGRCNRSSKMDSRLSKIHRENVCQTLYRFVFVEIVQVLTLFSTTSLKYKRQEQYGNWLQTLIMHKASQLLKWEKKTPG